jgi:hypothetical protein
VAEAQIEERLKRTGYGYLIYLIVPLCDTYAQFANDEESMVARMRLKHCGIVVSNR